MGYKYSGDAILGVSLSVNTPKPLDSRSVVNNLTDLYNIPENTAYQGMTVANLSNGNIYMLVDKSKIKEKAGWKASYESIQIISCTEAEYKEWEANTTENYSPIDETKSFLHQDTYYYIYEDSLTPETEAQQYLSRAWGESIEESLGKKASSDSVIKVIQDIDTINTNIQDNYLTKDSIIETFASKELLNTQLEETLSNYYTKEKTDEVFVTKESLRGGIEGDEDNFVFVTQTQYSEDQEKIQSELDKTIKTDGQGQLDSLSLNSIIVGEIKSPEEELVVAVTNEGLKIGEDLLAKQSEIPILETISESDYKSKQEAGELDENVYYYIYDMSDEKLAYVTQSALERDYDSITKYRQWVAENYTNSKDLAAIISTLQKGGDYITSDQILEYYTRNQANEIFQTIDYSEKTYATKQTVDDLTKNVTDNYVTIEMLKGSDTEDDDFMFVTQTQYSQNRESDAVKFETEELISKSINIKTEQNNINLTAENEKLLLNGEKVALSNEVPKIICVTQSEYEEETNLDPNTYYYVYEPENDFKNGFVKGSQIEELYYNKNTIDQKLKALEDRIKVLESYHIS